METQKEQFCLVALLFYALHQILGHTNQKDVYQLSQIRQISHPSTIGK